MARKSSGRFVVYRASPPLLAFVLSPKQLSMPLWDVISSFSGLNASAVASPAPGWYAAAERSHAVSINAKFVVPSREAPCVYEHNPHMRCPDSFDCIPGTKFCISSMHGVTHNADHTGRALLLLTHSKCLQVCQRLSP